MMLIMEEAEEAVKRADYKRFPSDRISLALIALPRQAGETPYLSTYSSSFKQPWQYDNLTQTHQHHLPSSMQLGNRIRGGSGGGQEHIGKTCNEEIFKENP